MLDEEYWQFCFCNLEVENLGFQVSWNFPDELKLKLEEVQAKGPSRVIEFMEIHSTVTIFK